MTRTHPALKNPSRIAAIALPLSVFAAAFIIRFLYIYELKGTILFDCLIIDLKYYSDWAMSIANGDILGGKEVFGMSPLYSYILAFIYRFITTDLFAVRLIQITIGSIGCVLLYAIGAELFKSRMAGVAAGLAAAFYGPFIFYDGMVMKTLFAVFFVTLMVFFLLRSSRPGSSFAFPLLAGASLALAALIRENVILLLPVIPVWFIVSGEDKTAFRLKRASAFLLGAFLVILPVTARNYYVGREFVLITNLGGENFYIGNNPESDGTYIHPAFIRPNPAFENEDFRRKASELAGRSLSDKEYSNFWFSRGKEFITSNPGRFMWLLGRKFILFWNFYEFPDNHNYYFLKTQSRVLGLPLLHFGIIAPLGILGFLLALRERLRFSVLHMVLLTYMASVLIFFNLDRYRLPAVPVLIIFAVYALLWLAKTAKEARLKALAVAVPCLAVLYLGVNYNVLGKDPYRLKFETSYSNIGGCYADTKPKEAFEFFRKALEINPQYPGALVGIANLYFQDGQIELAGKAYKSAIKANPIAGNAYNGLGNVLSVEKNAQAAVLAYAKAVELEPNNPGYHTNLGFALMNQRRYDEADKAFEKAILLNKDFPDAYWGLAAIYEAQGRVEETILNLNKFIGLSKDPRWVEKARVKIESIRAGVKSGT